MNRWYDCLDVDQKTALLYVTKKWSTSFLRCGMEVDDLMLELCIEVIKAAGLYDANRGSRRSFLIAVLHRAAFDLHAKQNTKSRVRDRDAIDLSSVDMYHNSSGDGGYDRVDEELFVEQLLKAVPGILRYVGEDGKRTVGAKSFVSIRLMAIDALGLEDANTKALREQEECIRERGRIEQNERRRRIRDGREHKPTGNNVREHGTTADD